MHFTPRQLSILACGIASQLVDAANSVGYYDDPDSHLLRQLPKQTYLDALRDVLELARMPAFADRPAVRRALQYAAPAITQLES